MRELTEGLPEGARVVAYDPEWPAGGHQVEWSDSGPPCFIPRHVPTKALLVIVADRLSQPSAANEKAIQEGFALGFVMEAQSLLRAARTECDVCGKITVPEDDCGGTCVDCMAAVGDPDCVAHVAARTDSGDER